MAVSIVSAAAVHSDEINDGDEKERGREERGLSVETGETTTPSSFLFVRARLAIGSVYISTKDRYEACRDVRLS